MLLDTSWAYTWLRALLPKLWASPRQMYVPVDCGVIRFWLPGKAENNSIIGFLFQSSANY